MRQRSSLLTTASVDFYCRQLREAGCSVHRDNAAGTVKAFDGEHVVLRAIQKGRGQPWIVTFTESEHVKWGFPDEPARAT